ncbi:MAG: 50S ribosomal protein P1 [Aigarchaeota archaeon]|nr:50S ribosomal protein P1 [Aigarchaeota archaeon]MCX8192636.1 50S ribosomal protein P1 [Nitrososphaeria archaeon]MDW7985596.1 50S ribosomal protein P1 [Nitrososphaerota archaeon]
MEYIYTALLLHKAGKPITEENVKKVLAAAGITPDDVRVKSLVAAISEINIEEVLKSATTMPVAVTATTTAPSTPTAEAKPTEKEEKKEEKEEEALAGLSALFG